MKNFLSVLSSTLQGGIRGGLLFLALLATTSLWAYDFQSGDLYYNITSDSTVAVTYQEYNSSSNYASISTVTIPETVTYDGTTYSVTSIGDYAFYGCSSLTSITIHKSVTSIRERAFENCSSLTSVTIPNNITRISDRLFFGCSALSSVTIPYGVISIGGSAFSGCSSLTSVTIPNSVKTIVTGAFRDCSALTSITIPEGVTIITNGTFSGCSSLTSVNIPNSVWKIGRSAFANCSSLASITIPNSVGRVESLAFAHCSSLISFTIHENMTNIESNILEGCSSLTAINVDSNNPYYSSVDGVLFNKDKTTLKKYPMGKSRSEYTIPNSVTSIGNYAFSGCSSLTSITIPNSVTSIGNLAFSNCSSLTSITLPNSVTSIGYYAFENCSSLTSITLPEGVTSIGESFCYNCQSLISITIPNSVTSIGRYAFCYCYSLASVTIGKSVTNIEEGAFYCNLEEIYCYPTTPPAVTAKTTFWNYNATLYVPCDSKEAYEEHPVFGEFKNIKGIDDCSGGFVTTHIHDTICQGEVYEFGEYICDTTGTYTAIIGDVTTFLYLTVLPSSIDTITVEACDSYEWHGKVYTESGVYTYRDPYNSCVIEELHLTIIDTPTPPSEPQDTTIYSPTEGIGVFSIGEGKTVTFSRGNLQYTQSTQTWSFAENQYDYLGTANVSNGALADKIDLFGWSASNTTAPFGVSTSEDIADYYGSFVDWGTNKIGNDAPNTWRTLTDDEWVYVVFDRPSASSLNGVAQVNGVKGLILLPDNWTCPAGVTFKSGFHNNYGVEYYAAYQTFTADQWSKLEAAGAVFLPAAGYRYGSDVSYVQYDGYYWSATGRNSHFAGCLGFYSVETNMNGNDREYGQSVRLVKDVNSTTPEPPVEPETEWITIYTDIVICEYDLPFNWHVAGHTMICETAGTYTYEEIVEDENYIYHNIYTLELTVMASERVVLVEEAYDSYEWHGEVYTESGTYFYEEYCYQEILELTIIPSEDKEYVYGTYYQDLVCNGGIYVDPITGENYLISSLVPTSLTWSDTVKGTEVDTIHTFNITPIVSPEPLTEDMLYAIGAVPKLVAGEKVDIAGTTELIMAYYQMVDQHDIADVIGVEWVAGHDVVLDTEQTTHTMVLEVWDECDYRIPKEFTFPVSKKDSEPQDTTICIYHTEDVTICEGETLIWMGMEYTETGTYTCIYKEIVEDEDYTYIYLHLHILYLTVLPYETIEYEVEAYDSYEWHGEVYTESGVYTYSDPYNPCVIEELHLTIIDTPTPPSEPQDTIIYHPMEQVIICEGDVFEWYSYEFGYYFGSYSDEGTYEYVLIEETEEYIYHHIFTLVLTVIPPETVVLVEEAYDSCEWHGEVYTESGTYTYQYECTTEVLYLTIIPSEDNQGEVVVEPSTNSVTITWQKEDDADTYIIVIKQGDKVVCTLIFDAEGNLVSVNYLPSRESNKHGIQHAGLTSDSFQYTITGLTPSTNYTYTVTATDDSDNTISSYSGEFTTHHATSVENTNSQSPTIDCQKILYEDHIYILRDGKTYTIMGAEVK